MHSLTVNQNVMKKLNALISSPLFQSAIQGHAKDDRAPLEGGREYQLYKFKPNKKASHQL